MFTTLINAQDFLKHYDETNTLVFDARYDLMDKQAGKKAYHEGHIPGAIYVDLHDDLSRPPATNRGRHPLPTVEAMRALFSELGITSNKQVFIYDSVSGAFAARMWWMLRHLQHEKVAVLDGGWQSWVDIGGPIESRDVNRVQANFNSTAINGEVLDIDDVDSCSLLIDSREPARYKGEVEPIDKQAGHIPGAINRFWKENLRPDGCFKDSKTLHQEFFTLFDNVPSKEAVFYCGSGVTACHNLLAVAHAGLPIPRLYAGSWSEWSATPGKPVATEL